MKSSAAVAGTLGASLPLSSALAGSSAGTAARTPTDVSASASAAKPVAAMAAARLRGVVDPDSRFFATAFVESSYTVVTESDGDLWPSCWADDGYVYTANGDGRGFGERPAYDIALSRFTGTPETGITGERIAAGDDLGVIWADPALYNRKPTGMLAVDGNGDGRCELYLVVQDLRKPPCPACFNDAPNATVLRSDDYGVTWQNTATPMFTDHVFTTVFFLDFGQASEHDRVLGPDASRYVYAYGIDYNWRAPTDLERPATTDLYLARVAKPRIQERAAYEFFAGLDADGAPTWTADIAERRPVLHDDRRVYRELSCDGRPVDDPARSPSVISQGSVVYNAPLARYIYSSWTWYTFEFYEAPTPWGPWTLFLQKDFGASAFYGTPTDEPCPGLRNGGYPTTIPSRFISDDGKTMWVQTSTWTRWNFACGAPNYNFGLRRLTVEPFVDTDAGNAPDPANNLAMTGAGTTPIEKSAHFGQVAWYNDGITDQSESSLDCDADKPADFWGYTWTRRYNIDRVVYTTGRMSDDGGWFDDLRVQVRQDFDWIDVSGLRTTPSYPHDASAGPNRRYTLAFDPTWGDGVRIIGRPGGSSRYTTIAELEVYFAGRVDEEEK